MNSRDSISVTANGHKTTFVFFGGLAGEIGIPRFEFVNITKDLPINQMFVRDFHQAWYSWGLGKSETTFDGSMAEILKHLNSFSSGRTVFVGNSIGGFAAILFGNLLRCDRQVRRHGRRVDAAGYGCGDYELVHTFLPGDAHPPRFGAQTLNDLMRAVNGVRRMRALPSHRQNRARTSTSLPCRTAPGARS